MKRLILQITLIISILCSAGMAFATENILNTILLEGTEGGYNIVLRADSNAKIKKKVTESGVLELTVKGMTASSALSTLYRNVSDVGSFVVENAGENTVKVYVQAPNISKTSVIVEAPDASPMPVHNDYSGYKFIAGAGLLVMLAVHNKLSARRKIAREVNFDIKIKDREMRLLRKYRNEITTIPSINYRSAYTSIPTRGRAETIRKCEYLNRV